MSKEIEVSIIIVSYNTKQLTTDCVRSIFSSHPNVNFEVIVVDNNSQDGSVEELEKLVNDHKNIKLVANSSNVGFSKANNQGIGQATGKYILLLNSDTVVSKDAIDELYEFALSDESVGVVGAKLLNSDGSVQPSAFYIPTISRIFQAYWLGKKHLVEKYVPKGKNPHKVEALVMAAFMISPSALKKVGKINEKYFMYFEDIDYCRSVNKVGLSIYYLPSAQIVHYHGASGQKLAGEDDQWKRLIPSAKIYYGTVGYYIQWFITRTAQALGE